MKRWVAVLLAIIGGAIAAYTTILLLAGLLLGVGYLWLFGDDLWPVWATKGFDLLILFGGLIFWGFFGMLIWGRLKRISSSGNG